MSYCLSPTCPAPQNLGSAETCACGAMLRLKGRYRALKPIAQGGFGRTFLAVDEAKELKPLCVIKQFFPQTLGADNLERARELFRQEALRLKELGSHDQIPELLDSLEQDDRQYLIQEFIDGQNLEQEVAQGAFREAQIRQLLLDLLPVLQFIHDRQVIHRDIKPANIIRRNADQKLVLVDLGAAKYATGTALGKTGTVIGSAEYTAPEQARGKAVFASDLYSLGATCIHLLTQMSPFDLYDSSNDRWAWRDCLKSPVSSSLDRILHKMLESGTNRRYQTATQVLADLNPTFQPAKAVSTASPNRPQTQSGSPGQHSDHREQLIAAFEPETRSWRWEIADGKVQRVPVHLDAKGEGGGKIPPSVAYYGRSNLVIPRSQQTGRVKAVLILGFITLLPLAFAIFASPTPLSRTEERSATPTAQPSPEAVQPIRTIKSSGGVPSIALSGNGKIAVNSVMNSTSGEILKVEVWNLEIGQRIYLPNQRAVDAAISSDGKMFVGQNADGTIEVWDLQPVRLTQTIKGYAPGKGSRDSLLAISPNGQILASGSANGSIELRNLQTGARIRTLQQSGSVDAIAVSPDGQTLASRSYKLAPSGFGICTGASADTTVTTWDLSTGKQLQVWQLSAGQGYYGSIALGSKVIAASAGICKSDSPYYGGSTDVLNLQTGELIYSLAKEREPAVSSDGKVLASLDENGAIRLWDLQSGKLIRTVSENPGRVTSLVFSPDGKTLASGNMDGQIKIWSVK